MPNGLVVLRGRISFSFLGKNMQQARASHILHLLKSVHHLLYVVAVNRSEVSESHRLEKISTTVADQM